MKLTTTIILLLSAFYGCAGRFDANNISKVQDGTAKAPDIGVKIPIDGQRWYQVNSVNSDIFRMFDGVLDQNIPFIYNRMLMNYDSYYEFKDIGDVTIKQVRFYDGEGNFEDRPMKLYAKADINARPELIATFTGEEYNKWITIDLPVPVKAKYLVINSFGFFPNEMELYGTYHRGTPFTRFEKKPVKLGDMFGINSFEWDMEEDADDPHAKGTIIEYKMRALKSFTLFRHYMDWKALEASEGQYTFNPTRLGGWNYDLMYERLKQENMLALPCLKTLPDWMIDTYPKELRDNENVPARYGSNLLDPKSYIEQAKVAFQFVARYGYNKNIDPKLVHVNSDRRWAGDIPNTPKIGLGYIHYIECENERDKWWKGRKAYQTAFEYAANLSAFYDGNKKTMGSGVGVKNADPDIKVVIGGICTTKDYIRGIIDWCKQYRGYNADGSVNLCFDVINYHLYNSDVDEQHYSQTGKTGVAPELSMAGRVANGFLQLSHDFGSDKEVWCTETGYDVDPRSPLRAPAIGNKNPEEVRADWLLRTCLLYARHGIPKLFLFFSYNDPQADPKIQFSTSGLLHHDKNHPRTPAADFIYQTNKLFGQYTYKRTIGSNPVVDVYELNGRRMYTMAVPDQTGRTALYNLKAPGSWVTVYTPKAGANDMTASRLPVHNGQVTIPVTETPVFVTTQ